MSALITWPASRIRQDENNRLVTDVQINTWNSKSDGTHTHDDRYYTETEIDTKLNGKANSSHTHTKSQMTDFPASLKNPTNIVVKLNGGTTEGTNMFTYDGSTAKTINITPSGIGAAASSHSHTIANVTGLQSALDGKAASGHNHDTVYSKLRHSHAIADVTDLQDTLDGKAASSHTHTKSQITDFPSTMKNPTNIVVKLNSGTTEGTNMFTYDGSAAKTINITPSGIGAAANSHTHTIANVTGLQTALDSKAASSHSHTKSQITDFPASLKNPTNIIVKLNGGTTEGTNMFTYDGSAAKSINITPANIGAAASSHSHTIANVTGLQTALDGKAASSHTHTKDQVGLGNVDNTSDSAKNVNMATKLQTYKNESTSETYGTDYPLFAQWDSTGKIVNLLCTGYIVKVNNASVADSANAVAWNNVSGKPSAFTPSSHTHTIANVTGLQTALDGKAASSHNHAIANVTGLQDALDGKAASSHNHTKSQITDFPASLKNPTNIVVKLNGGTTEGTNMFTYDGSTAKTINITPSGIGAAAASHNHAIANVTGLQTALDGKAASSHTHAIANVTGLQTALNGKAASSHSHKDADIESIAASKITGIIGIEHIPHGALDRLVKVDDDTARFKLTTEKVQLGDTVKVVSTGLMYYVVDESKLSSEDGYEPYTAGAATAVPWSGITGKPSTFTPSSHTHTIANVTGLQTALDGKAASGHNHDTVYSKLGHTHDDRYYTETEIDTKLNGKAASSHSHTKSQITDFPASLKNPTNIIIKLNSGTTEGTNMFTYDGSTAKTINITASGIGAAAASHKHAIANITGLQTALDGKAASSHTHTKSQITDFPSTMKNPANIVVKLNSGTTEGTNMFTYDGSAAKTINITASGIGAAAASHKHDSTQIECYDIEKMYSSDYKNYKYHMLNALFAYGGNTTSGATGLGCQRIQIADLGNLTEPIKNSVTIHPSGQIIQKINNVEHIVKLPTTGGTLALKENTVSNSSQKVVNWDAATTNGYYYSTAGAVNAPESTCAYFGHVCSDGVAIMQTIYKRDDSIASDLPNMTAGAVSSDLIAESYTRMGYIYSGKIYWQGAWARIKYDIVETQ